MKEEYSPPVLEVLGDLRDVTAASGPGWDFDLYGLSFGTYEDDVSSS